MQVDLEPLPHPGGDGPGRAPGAALNILPRPANIDISDNDDDNDSDDDSDNDSDNGPSDYNFAIKTLRINLDLGFWISSEQKRQVIIEKISDAALSFVTRSEMLLCCVCCKQPEPTINNFQVNF